MYKVVQILCAILNIKKFVQIVQILYKHGNLYVIWIIGVFNFLKESSSSIFWSMYVYLESLI